MKVCDRMKRLIDEADQPDALSFEVSNHLSVCADCKSFAHERAALRNMLVSSKRVSVPVNFDAMLNARIAEAKAKRAFSWLSAPSFMRLGTATAAVAVLVFVAQYGNLFSNGTQVAQPGDSTASAINTPPAQTPKPPVVTPQELDPNHLGHIVPQHSLPGASLTAKVSQAPRDYQRRGIRLATASSARSDYPSIDGGVVLVRGPNGEREVPMPTISVGAQPLLYVNAGRGAQPARTTATSF
jgi:hypothetical protein